MAGPAWWTAAFTAAYLEVYHHRSDAQAADEVVGLLPRLRSLPGPIVDVGCGAGRHLAALRSAGLAAIGVDLSADLLRSACTRGGCSGRLARADMRSLPLTGGFGAALCLFTAFGYFDDRGNAACLQGLARLVQAGGWVLLDLPDPAILRARLQPRSERTTPGGWLVLEERRLVGDRVEKTVEARPPGREAVTWQESVRLYTSSDLGSLAAGAGLALEDVWPGLRGPQDQSGRLVAWMRRPPGDAACSR